MSPYRDLAPVRDPACARCGIVTPDASNRCPMCGQPCLSLAAEQDLAVLRGTQLAQGGNVAVTLAGLAAFLLPYCASRVALVLRADAWTVAMVAAAFGLPLIVAGIGRLLTRKGRLVLDRRLDALAGESASHVDSCPPGVHVGRPRHEERGEDANVLFADSADTAHQVPKSAMGRH